MTKAGRRGGLDSTLFEGSSRPILNHSAIDRLFRLMPAFGRANILVVAVFMVVAVWTVRVSAQACPSLEGRWSRGDSWAVAAMDGIAFLGSGGGVIVVELGLDEDPRIIAELPLSDHDVTALDVSESILVAVAGDLRIFDLSDPSSPEELARFTLPAGASDAVVADGYVFIAGGDAALKILDIHDPSMPALVGEYNQGGNARSVLVSDGVAYLLDRYFDNFEMVDIRDVANPVSLATFREAGIMDLDLFGSELVMLSGGRLEVLNVDEPTAPRMVGSLDIPGGPYAVKVNGEIAYVITAHAGLRVVDLHDPTKPVEIGSMEALQDGSRVDVASGFALVANPYRGLWIIDVNDPSNPRDVGFVATRISARAVAAADDYAYVVGSKLWVLNMNSPTAPVEVGVTPDRMDASDIALSDGLAIVADRIAGVHLFDLSTPTRPVEIGTVDTPGEAVDIEAVEHLVYVADSRSGLRVIDISDPTGPLEIGHCDSPINASAVASLGHYVLVGDVGASDSGELGVRVIDVSDPQFPVEMAFLPTDGAVSAIGFAERFALIGLYSGQVLTVDVHDPLNPEVVGGTDVLNGGRIVSIAADGGFAYVSYLSWTIWGDYELWFSPLDVRNPGEPISLGAEYLALDESGMVAVAGRYVLTARGRRGLDVFANCSMPRLPRASGPLDQQWFR